MRFFRQSFKAANSKIKLSPEQKENAKFAADGIKKFGSKAVIVSGLDDKKKEEEEGEQGEASKEEL